MSQYTNEEIVAVTGTVVVDGSAVTQPISAASLPLPTGASTSAEQDTGNTSLSSIDGKTPALGQAAMAASSPVVIASNQTAVPVSGTVTANVGTTGGLALDATLTGGTAKFKIVDSGGTNVASVSAAGAVKVDGSAVTQPVSGPLTDTQLRATPVPVTFTAAAAPTPTVTSVSVGTSVVTLAAANSARSRLIVFNEAGTLFVKLGATASGSDYTYRLTANTSLEIDFSQTAIVTAIKASGTTNVQVTSLV